MRGETVINPEVYVVVRNALIAGLRLVREHEARGDYVHEHSDFPEMGHFESGFPYFSKSIWGADKAPRDYKSVFRGEQSPQKIPEWAPFYELARTNDRLKRYFDQTPKYRMEVQGAAEFQDQSLSFSIGYALENLVDRYIHMTKKKEFDEAAFLPIYQKWENAVFPENIAFDVLVPLLMVTCDFNGVEIANGLSIERMAEPFQLARSTELRFLVSANTCVVGAATHALVFRGWSAQNESAWLRSNALSSVENFRNVIERLDRFLAALRAITNVQSGYCQLIVRPDGWCDGGRAYLPQIQVVPVRAYPDHFEQYGWLRTPPVLNSASCSDAGKLYTALTTLNKNQMSVASRRLNLAMLRSSEQDSILDLTIGLETLLVEDGARGEINHKLAMRLAALCKMRPFEDYKPAEIFGLCKKLYEFRSAVAHGTHDIGKKRVIKVREAKEPIEAVVLGISLLRYAIRLLAEKPEYLEARKLDMSLFGDGDLPASEERA